MNQGIRVGAGLTRKQQETRQRLVGSVRWMMVGCLVAAIAPELAFAGSSPFTTGATAASTNLLAILTPIAVVAVMALGAAAWFNKISWGWAVAGIVGIRMRDFEQLPIKPEVRPLIMKENAIRILKLRG